MVDLPSRRIVGGSTAATMASRRAVDALAVAAHRREGTVGVIAHPDRGRPYASAQDQSALRRGGMACRRSGVGPCWDGAVVETTFGRLRRESCPHETYAAHAEAKASVLEYIDVPYNRARRHPTPGYVPPAEYERTQHPDIR